MKLTPEINNNKCTLCGKCVTVCPKDVLKIKNSELIVLEDECLLCTQCYDVCNFNAISFDDEIIKKIKFESFSYREQYIEKGKIDVPYLINSIRSRRSIRAYKNKIVDKKIIDDLIEFAVTAPSGSNMQNWEFTVLQKPENVWNLALEIKKFFLKLNKLASNPVIRYLSFLFMGKKLIKYYKEHMASVKLALEDAEKGIDRLFHGAPALIILHSKRGGSTPREDAQYASYNITLMAHALGLGTCYIGYATEALNSVGAIKSLLKINPANRIHAVLALGYPDVDYKKLSLRKKYKKEYVSL